MKYTRDYKITISADNKGNVMWSVTHKCEPLPQGEDNNIVMNMLATVLDKLKECKRKTLWDNIPEVHIAQELEIRADNLTKILDLINKGVLAKVTYNPTSTISIVVTMSDTETVARNCDWIVQDTSGKWYIMKCYHHEELANRRKIIIDKT